MRHRLTVGQKGIIRLPRFPVNLYRTQPGGCLIVGQRALSFFGACILLVKVATARESLRAGQRPAILFLRFAVCLYRWWQPFKECKSRAELRRSAKGILVCACENARSLRACKARRFNSASHQAVQKLIEPFWERIIWSGG